MDFRFFRILSCLFSYMGRRKCSRFPLNEKPTASQWLPLLSRLRSVIIPFFSPAPVSEYLVFSHIIRCSSSEGSKRPLSRSKLLKVQFNTCFIGAGTEPSLRVRTAATHSISKKMFVNSSSSSALGLSRI